MSRMIYHLIGHPELALKASGGTPSVLATVSGTLPLPLPDAIPNKPLEGLTQYGKCVQESTPSLASPADILCNAGTLRFMDYDLWPDYRRLLGITMSSDTYYKITDFYLSGADTVSFSVSINRACNVLGCYTSASAQTNYSVYATTSSGGKYLRYNGGTYNSVLTAGTRYNLTISPTGSSGFPTSSTWEEKEFDAESELLIGCTSVGASSAKLDGTLYGDIVVERYGYEWLRLIPVERISDGVIGYYDPYSYIFYEPEVGSPESAGYDYSEEHGSVWADPGDEYPCIIIGHTTPTAVPLFSVGNVRDEWNAVSGTLSRRCGACVYTGVETIGNTYMSTTGGLDVGAIVVYPLDVPWSQEGQKYKNIIPTDYQDPIDVIGSPIDEDEIEFSVTYWKEASE